MRVPYKAVMLKCLVIGQGKMRVYTARILVKILFRVVAKTAVSVKVKPLLRAAACKLIADYVVSVIRCVHVCNKLF